MAFKSGFVNIIGNPNVGKSTLMNSLVGEQLSIITHKAQTTRHRIMGIVNGEGFQIVYSDTPGIIKPNYQLQEAMMRSVSSAFEDADIILYITDVVETADKHENYLERLKSEDIPVILVINKIDLTTQENLNLLVDKWTEILPEAAIIPVSALESFNVKSVMDKILEFLPEGEAYFPEDTLTDKTERFFVSEIIRERILINYKKEIPYSTEVEIESFKEAEDIVRIRAVIHVIRMSQKGIIIGHQGSALKKTGTEARKEIETFLGKKVYLELFVKVNKDWRDKPNVLRNFGYQ